MPSGLIAFEISDTQVGKTDGANRGRSECNNVTLR
jgi:hypothetical protein